MSFTSYQPYENQTFSVYVAYDGRSYVCIRQHDRRPSSSIHQSPGSTGQIRETDRSELVAKGVTPEQVKRIKAKHDAGAAATADQPVTATEGRSRTPSAAAETSVVFEDIVINPEANAKEEPAANEVFGHKVFNSRNLTFEPNENAATPQDYRLGPGDEVIIDKILGCQRGRSSPPHNLTRRQHHDFAARPLSTSTASPSTRPMVAYTARPSRQNIPVFDNEATDIAVTLGQMRTIQVNIMGEVSRSGHLPVSLPSPTYSMPSIMPAASTKSVRCVM